MADRLDGPDDETPHERDSRRMRELLEETRVAMPGVQVLFAFLLAVPFQGRFEGISDAERAAYLVALLSAALATGLFIAPSAAHRVRFRHRDKAYLVLVGNRLAIGGFGALALSMTAAIWLVSSVMLDGAAPTAIGAASGTMLFGLWFVLALLRGRMRRDGEA